MARSQKKLLLNLGLGFGVLIGFIMSMFAFMSPTDLNNYTRLEDGAGETVQATSNGGAASDITGRRGSAVKYCTSWRHEIDGNERYFTDKKDCSINEADAKTGTSAELIYDPSNLIIMFVHSDETLESLKSEQTTFRIISSIGIVVLLSSIAGLVVVNRSGKKPAGD